MFYRFVGNVLCILGMSYVNLALLLQLTSSVFRAAGRVVPPHETLDFSCILQNSLDKNFR
jgi:hypothetical protein